MFGVQCQNIKVRSRQRACGRCNNSFLGGEICFITLPRARRDVTSRAAKSKAWPTKQHLYDKKLAVLLNAHLRAQRRLHFLLPLILVGVTFAQVALTLVSLEEGRQQAREERCNESGRRRHRLNKKAHTHTTKISKSSEVTPTHPPAQEHQQNRAACTR